VGAGAGAPARRGRGGAAGLVRVDPHAPPKALHVQETLAGKLLGTQNNFWEPGYSRFKGVFRVGDDKWKANWKDSVPEALYDSQEDAEAALIKYAEKFGILEQQFLWRGEYRDKIKVAPAAPDTEVVEVE
jgi:hypothetical protein